MRSVTPYETQKETFWCWAASSRMFTNHYTEIPAIRAQERAVTAVKGAPLNIAATCNEALQAACFYYSEDTSINKLNLIGEVNMILPERSLKHFLNDGHVVYISRGQYSSPNKRDNGHATLIVGYTMLFSDGELEYKYIIYDPWTDALIGAPASPISEQIYVRSYQWICNAQASVVDGAKGDEGIWDRFIVVKTAYSNDTVLPQWS